LFPFTVDLKVTIFQPKFYRYLEQ